jgi:hypothetical protein
MKASKRFAVMLIAALAAIGGSEFGEQLSIPGFHSLIPSAEAIVGRPLTPVSVAGVGRRTVRRCAVGVYNC